MIGWRGSAALPFLCDEFRVVDGAKTVFAHEFDEFCDAALFVGAEVIVDVPAEIIFPEIFGVFGAVADEMVEGIETKLSCFSQLAS